MTHSMRDIISANWMRPALDHAEFTEPVYPLAGATGVPEKTNKGNHYLQFLKVHCKKTQIYLKAFSLEFSV